MSDLSSAIQLQEAVATGRKAPATGGTMSLEKARRTAQEFEGFFLSQMLQPMFEGIETEEPFGGGSSEKIWRSMMVDEYGKGIARAGGIGIADQVMREILRAQEGR